jgi:hypothetical protein
MDLTELRIGNLVEVNGKIEKITGVIQYGLYFNCGYCPNINDWIKPIELTDEWFGRFGFEKDDSIPFGDFEYVIQYVIQCKSCMIGISPEFEFYNGIYSQYIKFVHQLQNLYFALTGQELKLNEELDY